MFIFHAKTKLIRTTNVDEICRLLLWLKIGAQDQNSSSNKIRKNHTLHV